MRPLGSLCEPPCRFRDRAMGFCLFNNAAIAARHLLDALGRSVAAHVEELLDAGVPAVTDPQTGVR